MIPIFAGAIIIVVIIVLVMFVSIAGDLGKISRELLRFNDREEGKK